MLGARSFVATRAVLPAIDAARNAELVAAASRSGPVEAPWDSVAVDDYDDVLADPNVEAVYLPLPNGLHAEWIERAAAAGKHVLCEKPLAPDVESAERAAHACAAAGVLLAEAWMTPHGAHWAHVADVIASGAIGELRGSRPRSGSRSGPSTTTTTGGTRRTAAGRCSTWASTRSAWPSTAGVPTDEVVVHRTVAPSGVDARTDAELAWDDRRASISCSFVDADEHTSFHRVDAMLLLERAAFTSGDDLDHVVVRSGPPTSLAPLTLIGTAAVRIAPPSDDPDAARVSSNSSPSSRRPVPTMIEAFADAVRGGRNGPGPLNVRSRCSSSSTASPIRRRHP